MTHSSEHGDSQQSANVQGDGNQTVQIVGSNIRVTFSGPRALRLIEDGIGGEPEKTPGKRNAAGFTPTGYRETEILWATNRKSLYFRGREAEVLALWDWLTAEDKISAHIITGAGGRGKTRLAVELAAQARADGWLAGFAGRDAFAPFNNDGSRWAWTQPTLIIVDYVAGKAEALKIALAALVSHPPTQNTPKLRFLLLERSGTPESFWWRHLFGGTDHRDGPIADLLDPSHVIHLQGLAEEDRFAVFSEAYQLASDKPPPDRSATWDQTLAQLSLGGEPLFLAMTGLVLARQGLGAKDGLTADKLAFDLAGQEQKRIEAHWAAAGLEKETDRFLPVLLAAVATLCGGLEESAAHKMIVEESAAYDAAIPSGGTRRAYTALHQALPGDGGAIAPLLPDILGEALILQAFGRLSDKGSAALTRASHRARRAVFDTVARCGRDFIIRGNSLPLEWLKQLHAESEGDLEALIELVATLPPRTTELQKIAAEITRSLVEGAQRLNMPMLLAIALNDFSVRLLNLGQPRDALEVAERGIKILDESYAENSADRRRYLAAALNNLSNIRAALSMKNAALAANEKSVEIYRTLFNQNPSRFWSYLAGTLNTLSSKRSTLNLRREALEAAEESVKIYNQFDAENSTKFCEQLAGALNNLSNRLSECGDREAALFKAEKCVELYYTLVAKNPDAFRDDLAMALLTRSNCLANIGKSLQALEDASKSVEIRRPLVEQNPSAFRVGFTKSLGAFAKRLIAMNQHNEARDAIHEAITTLGPLFLAHPKAVAPLMRSLVRDYLTYCEDTETDPDQSLLAPIITRFQSPSPGDAPDAD